MIVEHIIAKREEKRALAAGREIVGDGETGVGERGWVDGKREVQMDGGGDGDGLPSYGEAVKGV